MMNRYTFGRLFADPSFLEGMARVVDIGATLQKYNVSRNENEADMKALKDDWRTVGEDIQSSISKYEQTKPVASQ